MTAKEFLQLNYKMDLRIRTKLERLEELRAIAEKSTQTLTGMPRATGPGNKIEEIVSKIDAMQREAAGDVQYLLATRAAIIKAIRDVPGTEEQLVLELRYLSFKGWQQIAGEMHYDVRQVTRIHGKALQEVKVPPGYQNVSRNVHKCP